MLFNQNLIYNSLILQQLKLKPELLLNNKKSKAKVNIIFILNNKFKSNYNWALVLI